MVTAKDCGIDVSGIKRTLTARCDRYGFCPLVRLVEDEIRIGDPAVQRAFAAPVIVIEDLIGFCIENQTGGGAENIKDVLVWTKGLKDLLDRTKYDQMSRTFSHGPSDSMDILDRTKHDQYQEHFVEDRLSPWTFLTGPNMNKYQGMFAVEQTPT